MFPSSYSLRDYIHYLPHQENSQACSAYATLVCAEMIMAMANKKTYFSRLYLYYMTRKLQGRIAERGASIEDTLKALSTYGVCQDSKWPFGRSMIDLEPSSTAVLDGVYYKAQSYHQILVNEYKEYLFNNVPIISGMMTGEIFRRIKSPLQEQTYRPINSANNRPKEGHAVATIGWDDTINGGSWIVANSFGPRWGFQGYAAIPYSCNQDIWESYVITNFAGKSPVKNISLLDK